MLHNHPAAIASRREEDAAAALTSGTAFKRKVQSMCGRQLPMAAPAQAISARPGSAPQGRQAVGAVSARPVGDFLNKIGEGIFVGTFRGTAHTQSPLHALSFAPAQGYLMHEGTCKLSDLTDKLCQMLLHARPSSGICSSSHCVQGGVGNTTQSAWRSCSTP